MRRRSVMAGRLLSVAGTAVLCALLPAAASAHVAPSVTSDPIIRGTPQEGQTLTVTATWTGTATWQWLRCSATNDDDCSRIEGATSDRYVATAADVGSKLCVELVVTNIDGTTQVLHTPQHTAVIEAAPPAATPSPTPTPTPPPQVAPRPPAPPATPGAGSQASLPPTLLDPFPIVRIRGVLTPTGARVTLFTVRVPSDVRLEVRCRGTSCPVRRYTGRSTEPSLIRLRRLERRLRAGTRLAIKVTQRGRIGKWTTIEIRRGAPPKRADRCAYPDAKLPAPCPSG
jgi:hypothetical protein